MTGDDRYARQRLIPGWDQDRLAAATVVIAGVGALGNEVAKNLALAGVGHLLLCDPDTVAPSNLSRCVLFSAASGDPVGRGKVQVATEVLHRLAPQTRVTGRTRDLTTGIGLGELADADVVVGCLDSVRARLDLLSRCALVEALLVDGGTGSWGGEVRIRRTTVEGCYACTLTTRERGRSDVPWSCADATGDHAAAAMVATTALIAAQLSLAVLGEVVGRPADSGIIVFDGGTGQTRRVEVTRDPGCLHHRPLGTREPVVAGSRSTVAELAAELPPGAEPQAWTEFIVPGAPGERPRTTSRILDAAGDTRLCDLGIAPAEVLPVRTTEGDYRWMRLSS
ncbi:molybdopterin/thiamine biosynthesis adenylyltransferase [Micromonospora violae]|uniref:Molybdopterin/thiamine biosynthesis adenylyltransferase n=1 Tax=Micromonospora violae TaxID=1278207 RepID=A0A4Q7UGU0_9ACTN|nr:ThiF family adenylyltransferase [Micromonospora violae]RZT79588.1 molybdopterin/thiamine biosynthesis adenylyltransferase [Micromonospora violae]